MNSLTVKIAVSLVALFGLGVATGYVLARRTAPPEIEASLPPPRAPLPNRPPLIGPPPNGPAFLAARNWRAERLKEMKVTLKLTEEQMASIEKRFESMDEDIKSLHQEARMKMGQAFQRVNQEIAQELTLEQRRIFWQQIRERMERMKRDSQ